MKILGVIIPHCQGDLRHGIVSIVQQVYGVGHTQRNEILSGRTAGDLFKVLGEPIRGHQMLLSVFLNFNITRKMHIEKANGAFNFTQHFVAHRFFFRLLTTDKQQGVLQIHI